MLPSTAFVSCSASPAPPKRKRTISSARRTFLRLSVAATVSSLLPASARQWQPEELCTYCAGRGSQPCTLCEAIGTITIADAIVEQSSLCPNCNGVGSVKCPACIGLGLADIRGVLRNEARTGRLRMLRDGSYEILDCDAFPSCDVYGGPRRSSV